MRPLVLARPFVLLFLLTACVVGGAAPTIPPVRAEHIPKPPASAVTLIWRPGHWEWDSRTYQWRPGRWVPRAGHGPLWQDGFWRRTGTGYVWEPAHWI